MEIVGIHQSAIHIEEHTRIKTIGHAADRLLYWFGLGRTGPCPEIAFSVLELGIRTGSNSRAAS